MLTVQHAAELLFEILNILLLGQIGFISLLILEAVTNRGILDMVGIRVGGGLGLEI